MTEKQVLQFSGKLKYVVFSNEENGYFIGSVVPTDPSQCTGKENSYGTVTIVGSAINEIPSIGTKLDLQGNWINHPKFGHQFKFSIIIEDFESDVWGQEKFLLNYVKGLGPAKVSAILAKFGKDTFRIIREESEELLTISEINQNHIDSMVAALEERGSDGEAIAVLASYDITSNSVKKLMETYKSANKAVQVINKNPYQLIEDLEGFGFIKSDRIARKIGINTNDPQRIEAGVLHILKEGQQRGNTYLSKIKIMFGSGKYERGATDLLGPSILETEIDTAISVLFINDKLQVEDLKDGEDITPFLPIQPSTRIGPAYLYRAERIIEQKCIDLLNTKNNACETEVDVSLNFDQREAVSDIYKEGLGISIITGGAGVGKTFVTKEIIRVAEINKLSYVLLSPTGKAAKRLSEMTGKPAYTIHKYLEFNPHEKQFTLEHVWVDIVIIDESSMVDSWLMSELLIRIDVNRSRIILVGDKNQLPPVGAGQPFKDMIQSKFFPVFTLTKIMRTDDDSLIPINAQRVLDGFYDDISFDGKQMSFNHEKDADRVADAIKREVIESTEFSPEETQVLSPQRKGPIGTGALNEVLRDAINKNGQNLIRFKDFKTNDRVILVKNNYDVGYMNGDQGYIIGEDLTKEKKPVLLVNLEGKEIRIDRDSVFDVQLAYAITVHKSQGSEWKRIIIPVHPAHTFMLSRNLLYTGITRGRYNVTLVGTSFGLKGACQKKDTSHRNTWLYDFFQEYNDGKERE